MYCINCGKKIEPEDTFCPYCGTKVEDDGIDNGTKTQTKINNHKSFQYDNAKNQIFQTILRLPYRKTRKLLVIISIALAVVLILSSLGQYTIGNADREDSRNQVTFDLNYPNSENFTVTMEHNDPYISEPVIPERDGYQFVGWFTAKDYSPKYDFSKKIEEDITLYAKWYNPKNTADADSDGLVDELEEIFGTNSNNKDTDGDSLYDYFELNSLGSDPLQNDTDGDGTNDGDEDSDGDGITNYNEMLTNTSPIAEDSDVDGLNDYQEINNYYTDPNNEDTDSDGCKDGIEVSLNYDPLTYDAQFVSTQSFGTISEDTPVSVEVTVESKGNNIDSLCACEYDSIGNMHIVENWSAAYIGEPVEISMDGEFDNALITVSFDEDELAEGASPKLYSYDEKDDNYKEVANQIVTDGKIEVSVEELGIFQVLDAVKYGKSSTTTSNLSKYNQYSETNDSNGDGICDRYTMMINDGVIQFENSYLLYGVVSNFGEDCDDWDGDGLKNGEEIAVTKSGNSFVMKVLSNPLIADSDGDGFDDNVELNKMESDPMKYTKEGWDSYKRLCSIPDYEVSLQDNIARALTFEYEEFDKAEEVIREYIYTYAPLNSIYINQEKISNTTQIKDGLECLGSLLEAAKYVNDIISVLDSKPISGDVSERNKQASETIGKLNNDQLNNGKNLIEAINEDEWTKVYEITISTGKNADGISALFSDISGSFSGSSIDKVDFDTMTNLIGIASTSLKICSTATKVRKMSLGKSLYKNQKYQGIIENGKTSPTKYVSYALNIAIDVVDGATDWASAYDSYSKIRANLDSYSEVLSLINDISNSNGLNACYRQAAENVAQTVAESSEEYTNDVVKLTTKETLKVGVDIGLDTAAMACPYVAIYQLFNAGLSLIGIDNMVDYSMYLEITNELEKQCLNELKQLDIISEESSNCFTYKDEETFDLAEQYMTHLAQNRVLFEYYMFKYSYGSGISSSLASITGGVSRDKGEENTKNLIKQIYQYINDLRLGVSSNLPYFDEFFDMSILSDFDTKDTSDERDVVLVMDISSSMEGNKLEETKKAALKFVDTVLEADASISIVTYNNNATLCCDFSKDETKLKNRINSINTSGNTNIEGGISLANEQLAYSHAKKKIIVLMSDGEPNNGKTGNELVQFADSIKNNNIYLYTLGFFENAASNKSDAQSLMEQMATEGCHYEVADADNLVFFFEDIANYINGQKYIYVKIACPVEASVSYNGETISSDTGSDQDRASFGTISKEFSEDGNDEVKILRLEAGNTYDVQIYGTGTGYMDYSVRFMNDDGEYTDYREFNDISITENTLIESEVEEAEKTKLNVDEDGNGRADLTYSAGENQIGAEVNNAFFYLIVISAIGLIISIAMLAGLVVINRRNRKE